jgi:RNase adaptor protein for sRNA GlmZ degradation
MAGYLQAWRSNEPDDIRALFAEDAQLRFEPWTKPFTGHDEIVAEWLRRQDEADSFTFSWDVAGIDGGRAFIQAETGYTGGRHYSNLWVIDLAADGRATAFTEWWMDRSQTS